AKPGKVQRTFSGYSVLSGGAGTSVRCPAVPDESSVTIVSCPAQTDPGDAFTTAVGEGGGGDPHAIRRSVSQRTRALLAFYGHRTQACPLFRAIYALSPSSVS